MGVDQVDDLGRVENVATTRELGQTHINRVHILDHGEIVGLRVRDRDHFGNLAIGERKAIRDQLGIRVQKIEQVVYVVLSVGYGDRGRKPACDLVREQPPRSAFRGQTRRETSGAFQTRWGLSHMRC